MADRHQSPSYPLRLADDLKEQVARAAKKNGRSINAEIVVRLQESFRRDELLLNYPNTHPGSPNQSSEPIGPGSLGGAAPGAHARTERLYILLDSHGYPQSWAEIHEYLRALRQAGGFSPVEMETHIITPDMESSSRRSREAAALAKRLRAEGKSRPITGDES